MRPLGVGPAEIGTAEVGAAQVCIFELRGGEARAAQPFRPGLCGKIAAAEIGARDQLTAMAAMTPPEASRFNTRIAAAVTCIGFSGSWLFTTVARPAWPCHPLKGGPPLAENRPIASCLLTTLIRASGGRVLDWLPPWSKAIALLQ